MSPIAFTSISAGSKELGPGSHFINAANAAVAANKTQNLTLDLITVEQLSLSFIGLPFKNILDNDGCQAVKNDEEI